MDKVEPVSGSSLKELAPNVLAASTPAAKPVDSEKDLPRPEKRRRHRARAKEQKNWSGLMSPRQSIPMASLRLPMGSTIASPDRTGRRPLSVSISGSLLRPAMKTGRIGAV